MISSASYVVKFIFEVAAVMNEANSGKCDDQMTKEENGRQMGPTYLTMDDQITRGPEISHIHQVIPSQAFSAKCIYKKRPYEEAFMSTCIFLNLTMETHTSLCNPDFFGHTDP